MPLDDDDGRDALRMLLECRFHDRYDRTDLLVHRKLKHEFRLLLRKRADLRDDRLDARALGRAAAAEMTPKKSPAPAQFGPPATALRRTVETLMMDGMRDPPPMHESRLDHVMDAESALMDARTVSLLHRDPRTDRGHLQVALVLGAKLWLMARAPTSLVMDHCVFVSDLLYDLFVRCDRALPADTFALHVDADRMHMLTRRGGSVTTVSSLP